MPVASGEPSKQVKLAYIYTNIVLKNGIAIIQLNYDLWWC